MKFNLGKHKKRGEKETNGNVMEGCCAEIKRERKKRVACQDN
jgi:hypothetical protein